MRINKRQDLHEDFNLKSVLKRYAKLEARKGGSGGGGGKGGGGSGGKGGSGSSGKGSSGSGGAPKTVNGRPASSSGGTTSTGKFTLPSLGNSGKRGATPFSAGGGAIVAIPAGSAFAGRQLGGGSRDQVYGGPRYGSGYPYGGYGSYTGGRAFPFAFWPLYLGPHYYGDDEYGPERNNSRPGGNMTTVRIQSTFWSNVANLASNTTTNSTLIYPFSIIGDSTSVQSVLQVLVTCSCDVANLTIVPYDTTNSSQPKPWNIVQYYRASSFALALDGYNNTAELPSNMPASNASSIPSNITDTPLPTNHTDFTFLSCINQTIGESLPILDSAALPVMMMRSQMGAILGLFWFFYFFVRNLL